MAMSTSSVLDLSRPLSRSEWVSTLPPWRRLLAMLNWRPVYDIEQRMRLHEQRERESEKREHESERRTRLLESEIAQLDIEIAQLRCENKRLDALNSRMDALLLNADSSSQTPPATGSS